MPNTNERQTVPAENASPQEVLRQFRVIFSSVRRHFQSMEKIAGIGGAQIWALSLIASSPGCGINALTQAMDVHQSTASNLVRSLVKNGYVVSERSNIDKRAVELFALPNGLRLLKLIPNPYSGLLPNALQELDAATLNDLRRSLSTLIHQLAVDEDAAHTPIAML